MKKYILLFACLCFIVELAVSQNVGIGILFPAGKLDIKGSADISQ